MKSIAIIEAQDKSLNVSFTPPQKLSTLLGSGGVVFELPCGGKGTCLKCRVAAQGSLSAISEKERKFLSADEVKRGVRFACLAEALGDVKITLREVAGADVGRVFEQSLPKFDLCPVGEKLGVAVDVGTTTLQAYLYDLSSGEMLCKTAKRNPQVTFGADVLSRLKHSLQGFSFELAKSIRGGLREMIDELCESSEKSPAEVDAVVLAGNTAMMYLLCGHNPESIAKAPFIQDRFFGEFVGAEQLDLSLADGARVYLARSVSAYVGGDITAAMIATELFEDGKSGAQLLCDIGTNGEIVLLCGDERICCSTAAGPAFEGAGIYMGMTARTGAIFDLYVKDGEFVLKIVGGGEALGICGSGLLAAVAAMINVGIIDETGTIEEDDHNFTEFIIKTDGRPAFTIPGSSVVITQEDIRAVQLAKSAICAGIMTLINQAGLTPDDIEKVVIAGAFGSSVDMAAAEKIGLIPRGFAEKSVAVGNAAAAGASMLLLSKTLVKRSENGAKSTKTVDLSTNPVFISGYQEGMMFE